MKNWIEYFDSNGLLTQKGPIFDGGDTPSHEGLAWLAAHYVASFPSPIDVPHFLSLITTADSLIIRNPNHYFDPTDSSRDQYKSVAITAQFYNYGPYAETLYHVLPRNFLGWPHYPNGDLFTPQDYVLFNKAFYPTQLCADLLSLIGTLVLIFWTTREPNFISKILGKLWWPFIAMNPPNAQGIQGSLRGPLYTSDDLGAIMYLSFRKDLRGTFINNLSMWLYKQFRPGGIQAALDNYFAGDDAPPVNELFRTVIPQIFT